MNLNRGHLIAFAIGGFIGATVAVLVLKNKYQQMATDEINDMRDYFKKREDYDGVPKTDQEDFESITDEYTEEISDDEFVKMTRAYAPTEKKKIEYHRIHEKNMIKAEEAYNYPDEDMGVIPYMITTEQFAEGFNNHDTVSITYYAADDSLVDENDELIDDRESIVGPNLNMFGMNPDDENIIYVRNKGLAIDYEVCRIDGSYGELVLGLDSDEADALAHAERRYSK